MNIYSIYKATNTINGKVYIGFDSKWPKRKAEHLNNSNHNSHNQVLYNAIRKYGRDNFKWEVIYQSQDQFHTLSIMENYFILEYRSYIHFDDSNGYNMTLGGEGTLGWKPSTITKMNISNSLIGKTKGIAKPPRTKEARTNMSNAKKGAIPWNKGVTTGQIPWNKGKQNVYSEEQIRHLKEKALARRKGKVWCNDGINEYFIFPEEIQPQYVFGRIKTARSMNIKCCPFCNVSGAGGNMTRYHFDNCKKKGA